MTDIGIWQVTGAEPVRLSRTQLNLEKYLEAWIENDPTLIQAGLIIVGRQVHCAGGYIDLLAIDPYSQSWMIIEIKKGNVRRETVVQALDYAASVDTLSHDALRKIVDDYLRSRGQSLKRLLDESLVDEEMFTRQDRSIKICVVGTGRDDGLERIINYLVQKSKMAISVVEFEVFAGKNGEISLIRQLTETDTTAPSQPSQTTGDSDDLQRLFAIADKNGIGQAFRKVHEAAIRNGLFPRTYKWSIMYTPPQNKTRCCVVAWVKPKSGRLVAYPVAETIAEFFPIGEAEAIQILGQSGERLMALDDAIAFDEAMNTLFERIRANNESDTQ